MRSSREMAADRGMIVGALDARLWKNVGVRRVSENGVVLLGGSCSLPTMVAAFGDISRGSGDGLRAPLPPPFSSASICRSCSASMSLVDAVLRFVPLGPGARPTTVP